MKVGLYILAICRDVPPERLSGGTPNVSPAELPTSLWRNRIKAGGQCPPYWV
ncbi:hypothetical protein [Coleofasciculus sp. F4-SAH-05]|uniref:hypothetical protein n=1 Tax=Coleofasciculus sp. F4-SAH-05 TaxID=3069525 RepID=UPI0032F128B6